MVPVRRSVVWAVETVKAEVDDARSKARDAAIFVKFIVACLISKGYKILEGAKGGAITMAK